MKNSKIRRERLSPDEFRDILDNVGISDEDFRDLFNRNDMEIEGYKTGLQRNGLPHTPPTVSEMLVLDFLDDNPEFLAEMIEVARSRIQTEIESA